MAFADYVLGAFGSEFRVLCRSMESCRLDERRFAHGALRVHDCGLGCCAQNRLHDFG